MFNKVRHSMSLSNSVSKFANYEARNNGPDACFMARENRVYCALLTQTPKLQNNTEFKLGWTNLSDICTRTFPGKSKK